VKACSDCDGSAHRFGENDFVIDFQVRLERFLQTFPTIASFMETEWGWPIVESIHFVGLTLLFGSIAAWDLRLLGIAKHIPLVAFHRLVPWAVIGFAINAVSGSLFLMTVPNQYVYNPAFLLKMACLLIAGMNVAIFYAALFRVLPSRAAPRHESLARISGAVSLALWIIVIVCGRMITFYRPEVCGPGDATGLIATCIVR
jgi:hypothetical protein